MLYLLRESFVLCEYVIFVNMTDLHDMETNAAEGLPLRSLSTSLVSQQVSDYQHRIPSPEQVSRLFQLSDDQTFP